MLSRVGVQREEGGENKTLKYFGPPFVHTPSALSLSSAPLGELSDSGNTRSGLFSGRSVSMAGGDFCEVVVGGQGVRGKWRIRLSNPAKSSQRGKYWGGR